MQTIDCVCVAACKPRVCVVTLYEYRSCLARVLAALCSRFGWTQAHAMSKATKGAAAVPPPSAFAATPDTLASAASSAGAGLKFVYKSQSERDREEEEKARAAAAAVAAAKEKERDKKKAEDADLADEDIRWGEKAEQGSQAELAAQPSGSVLGLDKLAARKRAAREMEAGACLLALYVCACVSRYFLPFSFSDAWRQGQAATRGR